MEKTALVVGLGVSGRAACRLLKQQGYQVTGLDQKKEALQGLDSLGIETLQEHELESDRFFPLVVQSPGIPLTHPHLELARQKGATVIGEVELALRECKGRALAITGTNGKTTVTLLVEHVLNATGKKARALGNVGAPLSDYFLAPDPEEILVVELSSYQLETLRCPVFDAAVILNVTPDHLDRYSSIFEYAQAKALIQRCLKKEGELFLHKGLPAQYPGVFLSPYKLIEESLLHFADKDRAEHDQFNACAAFALCQKMGVKEDEFLAALDTFTKPSHRIEWVKEVAGVNYYDDSKGTNVDAVIKAVLSMRGPVILIAGGVDKGGSYLPWKESLVGLVKEMFLIGEAAEKIANELALFFNLKIVDSLEEAVKESAKVAIRGDVVLLSPGCSSFDMFRDYAHRGSEFQKFVGLLGAEND